MNSNNKFDVLKNLAMLTQLGMSMALPIFAGVYLGAKVDEYFKTAPLFLVIFILVFSAGSFINLFKMAGINKTGDAKNNKKNDDNNI